MVWEGTQTPPPGETRGLGWIRGSQGSVSFQGGQEATVVLYCEFQYQYFLEETPSRPLTPDISVWGTEQPLSPTQKDPLMADEPEQMGQERSGPTGSRLY